MKIKFKICLLTLLWLCATPATLLSEQIESVVLSNLPQYYPDYFEHSAILTDIDRKKGEFVFGVLRVPYDQNIQVHLLTTEFGTLDQLLPGMPLAFSMHEGSFNKGLVKQVWQLPSGTIPAH